MKHFILALVLILPLSYMFAQFAGGSGTQQDPYLIATPAQLSQINNLSNYLNSYYLQIADIDLDIAPYNTGLGWLPIGYYNGNFTFFRGTYDGGGKTISNLYINRPGVYCVGLFGVTLDAVIRNVTLRNVNVTGGMDVGGLAGNFSGTVDNCYVRGNVTATNVNGGGLIGYTSSDAVTNCYSTASGIGGGLIGTNFDATAEANNSYWDMELSGTSNSAGGFGRTTDEMTYPYAANTYEGWNFNSVWAADTSYTVNDGYPYLRQSASGYTVSNPTFSPAAGTYDTTVLVTLQTLTANANIYYTLDDTEPTESSLLYVAPIELNYSVTVKARAYKTGFNPSQRVQALYLIHTDITVSAPVFSPVPGFYDTPVTVTINTATEDAEIYYTLDWSIPTQQSMLYTGPIDIDTTSVFHARAFRTDWYPSDVVTAFYIYDVGSSDETEPRPVVFCSASPNPFHDNTFISFTLPKSDRVSLRIYNQKGQLVKTLSEATYTKGEHTLTWDGASTTGKPVPSGVYFVRMQSGAFTHTSKLLLLR
jgi:hypothetical protein